MTNDAIVQIRRELAQKRKRLEELKQSVSQIPLLECDIDALMRTLTILGGEIETKPSEVSQLVLKPVQEVIGETIRRRRRYASISDLAYEILRETHKAMTGVQLVEVFAKKGRRVDKLTLVGALYREAKQGGRFRVSTPGTFELTEWNK